MYNIARRSNFACYYNDIYVIQEKQMGTDDY